MWLGKVHSSSRLIIRMDTSMSLYIGILGGSLEYGGEGFTMFLLSFPLDGNLALTFIILSQKLWLCTAGHWVSLCWYG